MLKRHGNTYSTASAHFCQFLNRASVDIAHVKQGWLPGKPAYEWGDLPVKKKLINQSIYLSIYLSIYDGFCSNNFCWTSVAANTCFHNQEGPFWAAEKIMTIMYPNLLEWASIVAVMVHPIQFELMESARPFLL